MTFSRGPSIFGKGESELKTTVPLEVKQLADKRARELGMSTSEWVRDVALIALFGEDMVLSLYEQRVRGVTKPRPDSGDK